MKKKFLFLFTFALSYNLLVMQAFAEDYPVSSSPCRPLPSAPPIPPEELDPQSEVASCVAPYSYAVTPSAPPASPFFCPESDTLEQLINNLEIEAEELRTEIDGIIKKINTIVNLNLLKAYGLTNDEIQHIRRVVESDFPKRKIYIGIMLKEMYLDRIKHVIRNRKVKKVILREIQFVLREVKNVDSLHRKLIEKYNFEDHMLKQIVDDLGDIDLNRNFPRELIASILYERFKYKFFHPDMLEQDDEEDEKRSEPSGWRRILSFFF